MSTPPPFWPGMSPYMIGAIFYEKINRQVYSNDNTLELFRYNLDLLDIQRVRYSATLEGTLIEHLIHMTPLSWGWGATEGRLQKVLNEFNRD